MPFYSLTNFKIQKYYQNESKFNGVYSRNNLPKRMAHMPFDGYESIGTHWMAFYVIGNNVIYFHSIGAADIPKETKKIIGNKNTITNIYGKQAYNLIMCGYFCIGFIDFMSKSESFLDYTISFSPNDYGKNKIILKYFQ